MSTIIVDSAKTVRRLSMDAIEAIPESLFDIRPEGFNNTIRWNAGHLIYWMDAYRSLCFSAESAIPPSYAAFFNSGTKPADWTATPPDKEELLAIMALQLASFDEIAPSRLNEPLPSPLRFGPLTFRLAGELFNFGLMHESMHLATCGSLVKAASVRSAGVSAS
ncbi:DinB family protein [Cohnella sp. GCM10012308]|uniref:DinB family protein n=1 Tax=Cohnella sp. GCM10012308 TaxID=3317329 RepID=UPI003621DD18